MRKLTLIISSLVVVLNSCIENPKSEAANNEKLVKDYFKLFNQHKWEDLSEMYIENADFKDPSLGNKIVKQTKSDFIKKYSELANQFTDIKDEIINTYPSGKNTIVVEFISKGTAPDNSKFELPICTIFTIENNKITKDFSYYDNN